jgi:hypothetical protein
MYLNNYLNPTREIISNEYKWYESKYYDIWSGSSDKISLNIHIEDYSDHPGHILLDKFCLIRVESDAWQIKTRQFTDFRDSDTDAYRNAPYYIPGTPP